tara:strand:- start:100 stop:369 length:270 start_codon:yes stop_codon:yes gene_type:complete
MTNETKTTSPNETGFYGTPEHQDLVMKVMDSSHTCYYEKWNCYMSLFFTCGKYWQNFQRIEDEDLEVFTEKVRIDAAKYLELAHMKEEN